jgi:dinuclear metal center YbgI/SA1388 family protein
MADAAAIADHLDQLLRTAEIPDYPDALNGLQLAGRGQVRRVAAAVDFSSRTVDGALAAGAQMLLVHHGMFWGGTRPLTGATYERLARLIESGAAVYASHLPLDAHPEYGNNVLLARTLALTADGGFARYKTLDVGVTGVDDIETAALVDRARRFAEDHGGSVVTTPVGPGRRTRRWAICTGAGADAHTIDEALTRGIDTLIVGEGPHHTAVRARDEGLAIIYAGHYATETLGVRALADHLAREFGVEVTFVDAPTGL